MISSKEADGYLLIGIAKEHTAKHVKFYLTLSQKRKALSLFGATTFVVLDHYVWKVNTGSHDFDDRIVAKELGMTLRGIQDARYKLIQHGWVYQFVYRHQAVKPLRVTIVGEEMIRTYKSNPINLMNTLARIFKETADVA